MKLLAFELATEACSVALWMDGEVRERFELAPRRHAELSLPWAEHLLAEGGTSKSQLDAIAVGRGPGAFTGVRLAIALGQGIALALDRPMVAVSTLAALAMRAKGPRVLASIDARMNEVYLGQFELRDGQAIALADETILAPDTAALPGQGRDWFGVGTGFVALGGVLRERLADRLVTVDASELPHAADIARLAAMAYDRGEAIAADRVEPAYLRDNVALTIVEQQALRDSRV